MFSKEFRNFIYALATLVGTIVGGGIFGLPYVFSRAGFFTGLIFLIVFAFVVMLVHLIFGEVILRTKEKYRLTGFTTTYLGKRFGHLSAWLILLGLYGSILAYIIIGGKFLFLLFGFTGWSETLFSLLFFIFGAVLVFFGVRSISRVELVMSFFLLGIIFILFFRSMPFLEFENFKGVDFSRFFLPYGVILFSLAGSAAIPELPEILGRNKKNLKHVIVLGTLIPAILYILFVISILGVTGPETSKEAIDRLSPYLGRGVIAIGALFGFFAVFTSFLVLGVNLRNVFMYDYRVPRFFSWVFALGIPLALYLFGVKGFIGVIGFVGAVACGFTGIFIILLHQKARKTGNRLPEYTINLPRIVFYGLIGIFSFGICWEIVTLFIN